MALSRDWILHYLHSFFAWFFFFFLACSEQDVVKSSVALSAFLLTECSDRDTESCSFPVFFHILETL